MLRRTGGLDDEAVHLYTRGFYVEPLNHPVDMNKEPENGNEYLHQTRVERETLFPFPEGEREFCECLPFLASCVQAEIDAMPMEVGSFHWRQMEAKKFSDLALKLKAEKQNLKRLFPRQPCPVNNERDFCFFVLGSELYKKIYDCGNVPNVEGHYPRLSIILYFTQDEVALALKYLRKWYGLLGVIHQISVWLYAMFAVFQKPLSDENEIFLEDIFDEVNLAILKSDGNKNRLKLIGGILLNYFCVKAYLIGPPLERFKRLV